MSEWQPIETAPKDGTKILIGGGTYGCEFSPCEFYNAPNSDVLIVIWCNSRKHFAQDDFHYNPTHWMPVPEPPEDNTNKVFKCYCGKTEIVGRIGCCKDPDCIPY